jgi:hypothetical protein
MSEKLRTALQALDQELDRLQTTARQRAADWSAKPQAEAADAGNATEVRGGLEALRARVDGSIERIEMLLKEDAGAAR